MEIILLDNVQSLGHLGEVVRVKPGYARNFLIPTGKAVRATQGNREQFEARRAELEREQAERLGSAQKRADSMAGVALEIRANAGEEGKLFGSVGPQDVVEAAAARGIELDRSEIRMADGPIRQIGEFEVGVQVHPDLVCAITVQVVGGA